MKKNYREIEFGLFQFQNGAIKNCNVGLIIYRHLTSFNSKMVRLKAKDANENEVKVASFNSKMVRLKAKSKYRLIAAFRVSIPKWCD